MKAIVRGGMQQTGCYHLLYRLRRDTRLRVGALGTFDFPAGWYVYTGSAFGPGGLAARVARHRRRPTAHWHIDILAGAAELADVRLLPDTVRRECEHARAMINQPGASIPAPRFGATDCRCPAHLVRFDYRPEWNS